MRRSLRCGVLAALPMVRSDGRRVVFGSALVLGVEFGVRVGVSGVLSGLGGVAGGVAYGMGCG